jgi:hypothetical protein
MNPKCGIPLIYIAGPFSASTRGGVENNIRHAESIGLKVATVGGMPIVPHSNTSHPDYELAQSYEFWVAGTAKLMARCDGVLMIPGWEQSRGAKGEHELALKLGLPVLEYHNSRVGETLMRNWIYRLKGPSE